MKAMETKIVVICGKSRLRENKIACGGGGGSGGEIFLHSSEKS